MPYKVINPFYDKEDNKKHYEVGDEYPKGDYKPTKKRIVELSKEHPEYKRVFIEEVNVNEE
jgi:hypothetical protein